MTVDKSKYEYSYLFILDGEEFRIRLAICALTGIQRYDKIGTGEADDRHGMQAESAGEGSCLRGSV